MEKVKDDVSKVGISVKLPKSTDRPETSWREIPPLSPFCRFRRCKDDPYYEKPRPETELKEDYRGIRPEELQDILKTQLGKIVYYSEAMKHRNPATKTVFWALRQAAGLLPTGEFDKEFQKREVAKAKCKAVANELFHLCGIEDRPENLSVNYYPNLGTRWCMGNANSFLRIDSDNGGIMLVKHQNIDVRKVPPGPHCYHRGQ